MTVGRIFTKIGSYIENRQIFMVLNCNCPKLTNFKDFKTCLGGRFLWTQCKISQHAVIIRVPITLLSNAEPNHFHLQYR